MKKNTRRGSARGGFTLMEVMLVLAILVVLGSVSFFAFRSIQQSANAKTASIQVEQIVEAAGLYYSEFNRYPPAIEALWDPAADTSRTGATPQQQSQQFLDEVSSDPWGNDYGYEVVGSQEKVRAWSAGPDREEGTNDDIIAER